MLFSFKNHKKKTLITLIGLILLSYFLIRISYKGFFVNERKEVIKTMQASQKVAKEVEETLKTTRQTVEEAQKDIDEIKQMMEKYKE